MNKHTKLALILAPFLTIGGYIAAGYYADMQTGKEQFLKLIPENECKITQGDCKMANGKFRLNLASKEEGIHLATTHPIDHAVISLATGSSKEKLYKLDQNKDRLNWKSESELLRQTLNNASHDGTLKIRLLLTIRKTSYLAEINW